QIRRAQVVQPDQPRLGTRAPLAGPLSGDALTDRLAASGRELLRGLRHLPPRRLLASAPVRRAAGSPAGVTTTPRLSALAGPRDLAVLTDDLRQLPTGPRREDGRVLRPERRADRLDRGAGLPRLRGAHHD